MKKLFGKAIVTLMALILVFAMFTGMSASALPTTDTINCYGQDWEILEDEVYGCFESLNECVEDLDAAEYEEVDMDDSVWSFALEVGQDWWYSSTYYFTHDGPVKDNYACISPQYLGGYKKPGEAGFEQVVYDRIKNYASSVALDVKNERLALTLRGPWTANNGQAKFVFKAPKSGYVVLFNEGQVQGATPDSVFKSFGDPKGCGYVELCIKKNDVIISEIVTISMDSMSVDFPKAGTTGKFKVAEGDEIEVHLKAYDHTWQNNTVFIDPVVAYTEVIEDEVPSVDDNGKGDNGSTDANTNNGSTNTDGGKDAKDDANSNDNSMLIVIIVVGALVVLGGAGAAAYFLVIKKKAPKDE